jgi:anaerobic magnesium-protoporphyrin IX monomethyl ester cyclase
MCSTINQMYLFPPHDLLALAGVARASGHEVFFVDAVAEQMDRKKALRHIETLAPHLIVSIMSFELFNEDVDEVIAIKQAFPQIKYGLFGHYPTYFAQDTLLHTKADFVMLGEPDHIFENFLVAWDCNNIPQNIPGTAVQSEDGNIIVNEEERRVPNPNILPMPPYEMLKIESYTEPFMKPPFGMIQSARGCPHKCNYCIHSFGTKLTALSPENVLEHILYFKQIHGIRSLRFIDDTFTAVPSRVIKICKLMIEHNVNLKWTCLSRADTLDEEMLHWMKKAGCVRLAIGVESGSQRILNMLDKGVNIEAALGNILMAKKMGFEIMTFYLVGIPGETEKDVDLSIEFAKKTSNFIAVDALIVYPGTPLFEKMGHLVTFSLFPYKNTFTNAEHNKVAETRKSRFYRSFYFTPGFLMRAPLKAFSHITLTDAVPYVLKRSKKNLA